MKKDSYKIATRAAALLLLVTTLACCDRKDFLPHPDNAITFSLASWDDTKAQTVATGSFPSNTHIGVFGYLCGTGEWQDTLTPWFIYNTKLNTNGSYVSNEDIVYWPDPPAKVQFIAYYPYEKQTWEYAQGETAVTPEYSILTKKEKPGSPSLIFTTAESYTDQVDLLGGATHGPINTPASPVPLTFRHLLSKVGVFVKVDSSTPANTVLTIDTLCIVNWYRKARFNLAEQKWDTYSNKTHYHFISSGRVITNTSYVNILGDDEYMMLIPQSLTNVAIEGVYTVSKTVDGVTTSTQFTKRRSLYGMSALSIGKSLNMYFNFNPNLDAYLDISITLGDWTEDEFTTTIQ